jgi:hypothetical protein
VCNAEVKSEPVPELRRTVACALSDLRLASDQVRFYRMDAPENLAHAGGGGYEQ